ncbi:hypothetical protein [Orientia tsutsugamushi]|uniref:Uncharacterized protein n=1 Tax=Orientia tsutsugamushi TaxID=784 RepID=A0A2U3RCB3_ORITS|nr:hypothetical protein [Orientia tsutsugamushi]SPR10865.1 Uncharacterised protein [Orientia tsutsugamushi]
MQPIITYSAINTCKTTNNSSGNNTTVLFRFIENFPPEEWR